MSRFVYFLNFCLGLKVFFDEVFNGVFKLLIFLFGEVLFVMFVLLCWVLFSFVVFVSSVVLRSMMYVFIVFVKGDVI